MRSVAVAIHDVAPETLTRCAAIRDELKARGVGRVTMLAIPAPLGSPCTHAPEHVAWLRERVLCGDAVAQHGLSHVQVHRARGPRQWKAAIQGGEAAEFVGMDAQRTAWALRRGRAILAEAGAAPTGFVAPAYAYTSALRGELARHYAWWSELSAVRGPGLEIRSPVLCLGASTRLKRASSPVIVRGLARAAGSLMRIDVHPADFEHRRTRVAVDHLIGLAAGREAITYDELAGVGAPTPALAT